MSEKVIASLIGRLRFDVDSSGLRSFERMLDNVAKRMALLDQQAQKLQRRLDRKSSAPARAKADASARHALSREHRIERALQTTRKETFRDELAAQKLQYTGQLQQAKLTTESVRARQQQAVLDEKSARALQAQLKAQGIEQKNNSNLEASKLRQARLEKMLTAQQAKTIAAQQQQLRSMTTLQRAEVSLQQLRAEGARKVAKFNEQRAAQQQAQSRRNQTQQVAEQRRTEKFQQSQQRFQWAQQRQQHWQATRGTGKPAVGFGAGFDVAGLARANPILAGVAGVGAALVMLEQRIKATSNRVSESEQYENVLEQTGGKNKANQEFVRKEFERIAEKYGSSVDMESAKDFRTNIMTATSGGKMSLEAAVKQYETQQAAFRGAGMNREEQSRALIQLRQVRAKGVGDTEDYKTLMEAAPLIGDAIGAAWAKRTGFKGETKDIQGALLKSIPKGGLLAADFNNALSNFVVENKAAIEKQSKSIQAAQQRAENDKFLQQQDIDQSQELKAAIQERIKAEREMTKAMQPVNEALAKFDAALISATASVLNYYFKTPEVKELESKVATAQSALDKTQSFSPSHPARQIAESDLQKAKRELLDARLKAKLPVRGEPVPGYLKKGEDAKNRPLPPFLNNLEESLFRLPKDTGATSQLFKEIPQNTVSNLLTEKVVNNTTTNAPVTNHNIFNITGSQLSPQEIAEEIEGRMAEIARESLHGAMSSARANLVQVQS